MTAGATRRLVVVGLALPVVWLAQLSAGYAVVPAACAAGSRVGLYVISALALVVTLALAAAVVRTPPASCGGGGWSGLRGAVGLEAVMFIMAVVLVGLPNVLVDPCA